MSICEKYLTKNISKKEFIIMANFSYKRTTITALKVVGIIDTDRMVIDVDGDEKKLSTLLSDFNGGCIEINIKTKDEDELEEPVSHREG